MCQALDRPFVTLRNVTLPRATLSSAPSWLLGLQTSWAGRRHGLKQHLSQGCATNSGRQSSLWGLLPKESR